MSRIFISHSSKDDDLAEEVRRRLSDAGHEEVFLDFHPEKGIPDGRQWERVPVAEPPWRVFLSHTSELSRFPEGESTVDAAVEAINAAGHAPMDMEWFAARDTKPADLCQEKVLEADVYVGLLGLRYGSPVHDQPKSSYTELEFEAATAEGICRLVFLLNSGSTETGIPPAEIYDEHRDRQEAFRQRVRDKRGLTVDFFDSPQDLRAKLERALRELKARAREAGRGRTTLGSRSTVPQPPSSSVVRKAKVDETVTLLVGAESVPVVFLTGPDGTGKTILARHVGHDQRVRDAFPGGIFEVTMGQHPRVEEVASELYRQAAGGRDPASTAPAVTQLAEVLGGDPTLVIFDDVWPPRHDLDALLGARPDNMSVLVTTPGVTLADTATVPVDALTEDEGRHVLLGADVADQPDAVLTAADELLGSLGRWALLVDMAARNLEPYREGDPARLTGAMADLAGELGDDPTVLDDPDSRDRSFRRLTERSIRALDDRDGTVEEWFRQLAVYPRGAKLELPLLEDLWSCGTARARTVMQRIAGVGLATLVPPDQMWDLHLELHDLIVTHLHNTTGPPGSRPELHRQSAAGAIGVDGRPQRLTGPRARWLVFHLGAARSWEHLNHLPTLEWRSAYLKATGSDATYLEGLDRYASAVMVDRGEQAGGLEAAVGAILFGSHIRAIVGNQPIAALVTTALLGRPRYALAQAAQRSRHVGAAFGAILDGLPDSSDQGPLRQALAIAEAIPYGPVRSEALTAIAPRLAALDPANHSFADEAVDVAETVDTWARSVAHAGIARAITAHRPARGQELYERAVQLASANPWSVVQVVGEIAAGTPPEALQLFNEAADVAATIPSDDYRDRALAAIARQIVAVDPEDRDAADRAVEVARRMTNRSTRNDALAQIALAGVEATPGSAVTRDWALGLAGRIPDDRARGDALTGIARAVTVTDPVDLAALRRTADLAGKISDDWVCSNALAAISEEIASVSPEHGAASGWASQLASEVPLKGAQGLALAGIARTIADDDPTRAQQLFDEAVELARAAPKAFNRNRALADIAQRIAAAYPGDEAGLGRAIQVTDLITDQWQRSKALSGIVQRMKEVPGNDALTDGALSVARRIPHDWLRSQVLAGLAQDIASTAEGDDAAIDTALEIARTIPLAALRGEALAAIAQRIASTGRGNVTAIDKALETFDEATAATSIPDDGPNSQALTEIVQEIIAARSHDVAALSRALELTSAIRWPSRALAAIAPRFAAAGPGDPATVAKAVEIAGTIPDSELRSRALAAIAGELTADDPARRNQLLDEAVGLAGTTSEVEHRSRTLAFIAREVMTTDLVRGTQLLDDAVGLAGTISAEWRQSETLAEIARDLIADGGNEAALSRALDVAERIPDAWFRSDALAAILPEMASDPADEAALSQALEVAQTFDERRYQAKPIVAIARKIATDHPARASHLIDVGISLASIAGPNRSQCTTLAWIAREIAAVDPTRALQLFQRAIDLVTRDPDATNWESTARRVAREIAAVEPRALPIDRVVTMVQSIPDTMARSRALLAIAQWASRPDDPAALRQAVTIAKTIEVERFRYQALAGIAGGVGDVVSFVEHLRDRVWDLEGCLFMVQHFLSQDRLIGSPWAAAVTDAVATVLIQFPADQE